MFPLISPLIKVINVLNPESTEETKLKIKLFTALINLVHVIQLNCEHSYHNDPIKHTTSAFITLLFAIIIPGEQQGPFIKCLSKLSRVFSRATLQPTILYLKSNSWPRINIQDDYFKYATVENSIMINFTKKLKWVTVSYFYSIVKI